MVEQVLYRQVNRHGVWWEVPASLAHDADGVTVLWWPAGTRYRVAAFEGRSHALGLLAVGGWELEEKVWWGGPGIHVIPDGAPYALWPYRSAEGELIGWYCNLQEPLRRSGDTFETNDWTLDIVASPDLSSWQWKDQDELEEGLRVGLYSAEDVTRIRAAGEDVIRLIESRAPIFASWADWVPADRA